MYQAAVRRKALPASKEALYLADHAGTGRKSPDGAGKESSVRQGCRAVSLGLGKVVRALQKHHQKALTPQGRQSVKKLMNHYGGKSAMPYVGAPKEFDRIAKEFHVDYAFHKVSPGHYLLFFKANQADAITAAFQKYSAKVLNKEQDKASILGQLRKFTEQIRTQAKEKQRTREAVKDGR